MNRLPAVVFAMLVVASAGAFFVVQHLKSTTPLITGSPAPDPAVFNPRAGVVCTVKGKQVDFSKMRISFYLLHRSDDVDVYMIDQSGEIVATLASGRHMIGGAHPKRVTFTWDGRQDDGRFAPDGIYFVRVDLIHQGRTYVIGPQTGGPPSPVKVETHIPTPVVTSVSPARIPATPGATPKVTIHYAGNEGHYGTVRIYRTDQPGRPRLVDSFETPGPGTPAVWNGTIDHRPAPAGVYLVGIDVTDAACNTGHFPRTLPPAPGSTPHAGVSVRYLTAAGPLTPVPPGGRATIAVDALGAPYAWALRRLGAERVLASGTGSSATFTVTLPRGGADVYALRVRAGRTATTLPLVASASHGAPVLVVLPALTWQGENPVDDAGDGLPSTLSAGDPVLLDRPLVGGLPADLTGEMAVLTALRRAHLGFDLTTDLALAQGVGPSLATHHGAILAGAERWVTPVLASALRAFAARGATILSFGRQSLRAYVRLAGDRASQPTGLVPTDIFGIRHGDSASGSVSVLSDALGLFAADPLAGVAAYEPITAIAASDQLLCAAGVSDSSLAVAAVRHGSGNVIEVGLRDVAHDPAALTLLRSAYGLMTG